MFPVRLSLLSCICLGSLVLGCLGPPPEADAPLDPATISELTQAAAAGPNAVIRLDKTQASGAAPLLIQADATTSTCPGSYCARYQWDFGDGSPAESAGYVTHLYPSGSYVLALTVTDGNGQTHRSVLNVSAGTDPNAPAVTFAVSPSSGSAPLAVWLDGSATKASTGSYIASCRIDFGDGTSAAKCYDGHTYSAGKFTATFTATDNRGRSASASRAIDAGGTPPVDPNAPTVRFLVSPTSGNAPLTVSIDGSETKAASDSYLAACRIDFGDGTSTTRCFDSHVYPAGNYTTTFTGTDSKGRTASASVAITSNGASVSGASVAVVGSAGKVRPTGRVDGPTSASLVAGRNEFESFQIIINATGAALPGASVAVESALTGPGGAVIPQENVTVYRVAYYNVRTASDLEGATGLWPDPLIPSVDPIFREARRAFPVDVPANENRAAWVDIQVPIDAAPGVYTGSFRVTAPGFSARVPVRLEVLNFTLPSTTSLKSAFALASNNECQALGFTDCDTNQDRRAYAKSLFVRSAIDNRITVMNPHSSRVQVGSATNLAEFRKYSLPYLKGTGASRLPGARLTSYAVTRPRDRNYAGWKAEFEAQKLVDKAFIYACDEPYFFPVYGDEVGNWKVCKAELNAAIAGWPQVSKLVTAHIQSSDAQGATQMIDKMVVNEEFLDGPDGTAWFEGDQRPLYDVFLANTSRPKEVWIYAACGSHGCTRNNHSYTNGWTGYEIDSPASEQRAMAWTAFRYRLNGALYYDMAIKLTTAWDDQYYSTGNGDGTLFYAGTPSRIGGTRAVPIESLRMKYVRDGYEDYEYLKYLRDHGRSTEAYSIARSLFPTAYSTSRTDAQVQAARKQLVDLVRGLVSP